MQGIGIGGGIRGTIANNQIAVGTSAANTVGGSSGLTWNGSTLSIDGKVVSTDRITSNEDVRADENFVLNSNSGSFQRSSVIKITMNESNTGDMRLYSNTRVQHRVNSILGMNLTIDEYELFNTAGNGGAIFIDRDNPFIRFGGDTSSPGGPELARFEGDVVITGTVAVNDKARIGGSGSLAGQAETLKVQGDFLVTGDSNLSGGLQIAINLQSGATYQILKSDHFLVGDNTFNNVVFTLPAIIDDPADNGRLFVIDKFENGVNYVEIQPNGLSEISGETTGIRMGLRNDSITLIASGGNWFQKQRNTGAFSAMDIASVPTSSQAIGIVTPVVVNGFDNVVFETPGILSANATADTITVDHIEAATVGGDGFVVGFQLEIDYSLNNQELLAEIFLDGVGTGIQDLQPTSNAFNTILKAESLIQVPDGVAGVFDVRLISSSAGNAIYHESSFVVQRLTK